MRSRGGIYAPALLSILKLHRDHVGLALATAGCTKIMAGDRVAVAMTDGRSGRFRVQSVDSEALISQTGERYVRAEMRQLRRASDNHTGSCSQGELHEPRIEPPPVSHSLKPKRSRI
jgi:hypothetical protein